MIDNRIQLAAQEISELVVKTWGIPSNAEFAAIISKYVGDAWIPVSERLPEDGDSALIYVPGWEDKYLLYRVGWIDYDVTPPQWIENGEAVADVTHWRPLPVAPEEGK
jgi:hypothetical protein